jgi:hypothetical protein
MGKINFEQAEAEVKIWLDYKKVGDKKREANKDSIESLIEAVCEGNLTLDLETKVFTQHLKFPTEGEMPMSSLEYKPRIKIQTVHHHLQDVKVTDMDGRILAHVAALTSKPKALIKSLETEDYSIAMAIAVFFV